MMTSNQFKNLFNTVKLKGMGNDKLMEVAYHEAGHALINLLYKVNPGMVSIISNENTAGYCNSPFTEHGIIDWGSMEFDYGWDEKEQLEYLILMSIGGIIGGAFYSGEYSWEGANKDLNEMLHYIAEYAMNPDLQPYWDKTFKLIQTNKEYLVKIASELYYHKTLDSKYFETLINNLENG